MYYTTFGCLVETADGLGFGEGRQHLLCSYCENWSQSSPPTRSVCSGSLPNLFESLREQRLAVGRPPSLGMQPWVNVYIYFINIYMLDWINYSDHVKQYIKYQWILLYKKANCKIKVIIDYLEQSVGVCECMSLVVGYPLLSFLALRLYLYHWILLVVKPKCCWLTQTTLMI